MPARITRFVAASSAMALLATPPCDAADPPDYSSCGDCHCIPGNGGLDPCPTGEPGIDVPQGPPWDEDTVAQFESLEANNPIRMLCDPHNATGCPQPTDPPQDSAQLSMGDEAVCAIKYDASTLDGGGCPTTYDLGTYDSTAAAEEDGAHPTHFGACGACSTTRDLAAYMRYTDLTKEGTTCVLRGLSDPEGGVECFMDIGYTEHCARMWMYDGFATQRMCSDVCMAFVLAGDPNNGPPPSCDLAECLQCNEDKSGPVFATVAARTRRRSGMLSMIVRPCKDVLMIKHMRPYDAVDGCDKQAATQAGSGTVSPTEAPMAPSPTRAPTASPTAAPSAGARSMSTLTPKAAIALGLAAVGFHLMI